MPRLLVSTSIPTVHASIRAVCDGIGWEFVDGAFALEAPELTAQSGADAAFLDVDSAEPEVADALRRLSEAFPFFPVIVLDTGADAYAEQGSTVLYHVNPGCIEDLEHILISLSCAGFPSDHAAPAPVVAEKPALPRVLVVDDDVRFNAAMVQALRSTERYDIRAVHSGFQAGAVLSEFRPHLVIVDISLGDMDGREVCAFIRRHATLTDTKVIGVSGYVPPDVIEDTSNSFDGFMEKPFLMKDLVERVHTFLT